MCFSAEDPESLRGPQFDAAWADELCIWPHPDETLMTLSHGLRLGRRPQLIAATRAKHQIRQRPHKRIHPIRALREAGRAERAHFIFQRRKRRACCTRPCA
ncbi:MAG: terminase family protein [Terricaulis sp.]